MIDEGRTELNIKVVVVCIAMLWRTAPGLAAARPPFDPWIDGTSPTEPEVQIQQYDRDTYVLRQSLRTNFEGPLVYLLFGSERALLLDTGAGGLKIRPSIDATIAQWLAAHHRTSIPLVVAHSHSHDDHHQGDVEFSDRPDTVVVGLKPQDVAAFFKIANWPNDIVTFDLGKRTLDIIPTPGHQAAHIMIFDERTRLLLSGDSLYPGRLYVPSNMFMDFRASIDRVVAFTKQRRVSHILGAHIEMTDVAGKDFVLGSQQHPHERVLQLPYSDLLSLQASLKAMGETVVRHVHDDFIVFPRPPR
jgi:glyoxylase-like metal-dependent hydrolase (beta-lactamase superfamily II)